jgi:hypothetical protein
MRLDAYDDMMGLEYGNDALDGLFDPEMLKQALLASAAGGGAILLTTYSVKALSSKLGLETKIPDPLLRAFAVSGTTFLAGLAGGRMLAPYSPRAGLGIAAGVGALSLANLIDAMISKVTGNPRMFSGLGDASGDMLDAYGEDDGMSALAALETTSVESAPGAFSGFADPTVTPEALMGLEAAVTQQETLGYAPYLS